MQKPLYRLICEFYPYRFRMLWIVLLGLVVSAVQPVSIRLSQQIIDEFQRGSNVLFFRWAPWALVGIFFINGVSKYFYNTLRKNVTECIIQKFRSRLFNQYLHLPMATLDGKRSGEMLSNLQNDLSQIGNGYDTLCDLIKEPFTFLGLIGVAFYCDWKLTLFSLAVAPAAAQQAGGREVVLG